MRSHGEETGDDDIARLSPLMHGHIIMLGALYAYATGGYYEGRNESIKY
ncbi:hypothetical protein N037_21030 [Enterobacter sp. EGD-HP1]|nr:hypothetical protein N037_21030 [Enterobacter sp. EGD-HP1]